MKVEKLPYWFDWLIRRIIKVEFLEEILGDLRELYVLRKEYRSSFYCAGWLVFQALLLFKRPLLKPIYPRNKTHFIMLRTHLKIGIRSLWKFKNYTLINLFGLSVGAAAAIILFLAATFEKSYDLYLPEHEQIYRVGENHPEVGDYYQTRTPLAPAFKEAYPEVLAATRFFNHSGWFSANNQNLQTNAFLVDQDFSEIFQFEVLAGDFQKAISSKGSIVLTAKHANKFFGYDNAIGKVMTKYPEGESYLVSAIIADPPANSSLQFEALVPWSNAPDFLSPKEAGNWYNTFMEVYVKLAQNASLPDLLDKTESFVQQHFVPKEDPSRMILLPLTELHAQQSQNGKLIGLLLIISLAILLIAGFNFINLNTAQLLIRLKEIGIRKVMGSRKSQIISQFVIESLIMVLLAVCLAVGLTYCSFPLVERLFDLQLKSVWLQNYSILPLIFFMAVLYGISTSLIPAFMITRPSVTESIKGTFQKAGSKHLFQKGLIVVQFVASIFLISGTYIIWQQINFMKSYDLNFDKDNTFIVYTYPGNFKNPENLQKKLLRIKDRLNNHAQVASASFSYNVPGQYWDNYNNFIDPKDPEKKVRLRQASVDANYFSALNVSFIEGGKLEEHVFSKKKVEYAVLNEAAMKVLGWDHLEGRSLREDTETDDIQLLGVTKDFHYRGLDGEIEPFIHWVNDSLVNNVLTVRLQDNANGKADFDDVIALLEEEWQQLDTFEPFDYEFLDDSFNEQYEQQERLGYLAGFFSIIAIIIAALGLFSLSAFMIRRRKKEIGIRKVLGATIHHLIFLLSKNFLFLVLIALVVSIPIVILSANQFLDDFAYQIQIRWPIFLWVSLFTIGVATLSVSIQAFKTSLGNPVDEIKEE